MRLTLKKKAEPEAPARRTSAALAAIPRRTPVWIVRHVDPLADSIPTPGGKPLPTRPTYMNRAERRAYARLRDVSAPAGEYHPYERATTHA